MMEENRKMVVENRQATEENRQMMMEEARAGTHLDTIEKGRIKFPETKKDVMLVDTNLFPNAASKEPQAGQQGRNDD
ncbi:unnamed protein product [Linum trigynum]|uniref:Uncharacterized protein n=1 Tax=Linum trigynum TaxID=586398 RepID=A0AAV2EQ19_9ROSI